MIHNATKNAIYRKANKLGFRVHKNALNLACEHYLISDANTNTVVTTVFNLSDVEAFIKDASTKS